MQKPKDGFGFFLDLESNKKQKVMNKEQIIDKVYKRYVMLPKELSDVISDNEKFNGRNYTQEEFINKIKTNPEFSEKWGLKIEKRDLSLIERSFIAGSNHYEVSQNIKAFVGFDEDHTLHKHLDEINIPTKLITITYNNKTIESYE